MALEDLVNVMKDIATKEIDDATFADSRAFYTRLQPQNAPGIGGGWAQELQSRLVAVQEAQRQYRATEAALRAPGLNQATTQQLQKALSMFKQIKDQLEEEYKKAAIHHTGVAFMKMNPHFEAYLDSRDANGNELIPTKNRYNFISQISGQTFGAITAEY